MREAEAHTARTSHGHVVARGEAELRMGKGGSRAGPADVCKRRGGERAQGEVRAEAGREPRGLIPCRELGKHLTPVKGG